MKTMLANQSCCRGRSTPICRSCRFRAVPIIIVGVVLLASGRLLADGLVLIGSHPTSTLTALPTIHTMKAFEGRIYFGYGEWQDANFPAVVVTSFDPASNVFHLEFSANTDSIGLFREINGVLYAPSCDPTLYAESADYSYRAGGVWRDSVPAGMLHVFDVATLDGSDLWLAGSKSTNETAAAGPAVFRSADGGRTWQDLTIQSPLADPRYYYGFALRGRFYVRDTYYEGTNGTRVASTYAAVNRATLMNDGTNDFIVGVTAWPPGSRGPRPTLLVTYDTQTWRILRGGNIVYHFTVSGSNIYTLETNASANALALWMASDVTPSQATWQQLANFNNVPPNAKALEVWNGVIYVADTQGRLWAGRLDGGAVNTNPPSIVNHLADDFGRALSFDGGDLAVGAPDHSGAVPLSGQVTIWKAGVGASATWTQAAVIDPPAPSFSGWFGKYLVLKDDLLAVVEAGRDLSRIDRGSSTRVHLYERVGEAWTWRQSLDHAYAQTVALDSGWLAVGVGGTGNGANALYLYTVSRANGFEITLRTNFFVQAHIPPSADTFWRPAARVALESNVCAFAAVADSSFYGGPGEVQVFQRDGAEVWRLRQVVQSPAPTPAGLLLPPDRFGHSLALHNGWLAVGAPRDDTAALQAGAVHLYENTNTLDGVSFVLRQTIHSPVAQANAAFGNSVTLKNSTLLVGCPGLERNNQRHHGGVFVFRREQNGWTNVAEITRPSASAGEFGNTVAFGSNWLAASSRFANSSTNVADRVTLWHFGPPGGELFSAHLGSAGAFELSARGEVGQTYSLQVSTRPAGANWTNLFRFTLTTPTTNLVDPAAITSQGFYRLTSE